MPTLEWIGKKVVLNHHRQVPYRLLHADNELSVGDPDSGNLLVEGDNLLALRALLPYYAGKVKCIYIDPPYNTGNENWIYNDAAKVDALPRCRWDNSPEGRLDSEVVPVRRGDDSESGVVMDLALWNAEQKLRAGLKWVEGRLRSFLYERINPSLPRFLPLRRRPEARRRD